MYYPPHFDRKELFYFNRKERINKNFAWTKEEVQKLRKLNEDLAKMQDNLVEEIYEACEVFSNLEKNGMSFLHGFKVIGKISFEKSIINELEEQDELTKKQRKIIDKWDDIYWISSDRIEAWQLIFDSETCDFSPLSKVRLNQQKNHIWNLDIADDEEPILFCSYLSHFIESNISFSSKDLAECTVKDFSPVVTVILNYNVSELSNFSSCYPYRNADCDFIYNMLNERCHTLNTNFEWSKNNILKMLEVNSWVWKRTDEMKKYINELNGAFQELSKTNPKFKYYSLEAQLEYHGSKANDVASLELQQEMTRRAAFHYWNIRCGDENPEIRDEIHEDEKLNWNFEIFRNHFTEEQQKVRFHYFMHILFVDDWIYSFEDLVRMREEDFKICLEINYFGDEKTK